MLPRPACGVGTDAASLTQKGLRLGFWASSAAPPVLRFRIWSNLVHGVRGCRRSCGRPAWTWSRVLPPLPAAAASLAQAASPRSIPLGFRCRRRCGPRCVVLADTAGWRPRWLLITPQLQGPALRARRARQPRAHGGCSSRRRFEAPRPASGGACAHAYPRPYMCAHSRSRVGRERGVARGERGRERVWIPPMPPRVGDGTWL